MPCQSMIMAQSQNSDQQIFWYKDFISRPRSEEKPTDARLIWDCKSPCNNKTFLADRTVYREEDSSKSPHIQDSASSLVFFLSWPVGNLKS